MSVSFLPLQKISKHEINLEACGGSFETVGRYVLNCLSQNFLGTGLKTARK